MKGIANGKGFMFTIDALLAITLVAALAAMFMAYYSVVGVESHALQMHEKSASDAAVLKMYGASTTATSNANAYPGSCYYVFTYNKKSGLVDSEQVCRSGFTYE